MKQYDFVLAFILCILVMIFNEIWAALDKLPELFKGGDILYHIMKSGITIVNNIGISVAAAIIFYYAVELLGKKKNYRMYTDIRKDILFMFYKHLEVLTKLDSFIEIDKIKKIDMNNKSKIRIPGLFDIYDVPVLVELFEKISIEEKVLVFKEELKNFYKTQTDNEIERFCDSFKKDVGEIKSKIEYRYFKESRYLIDSICSLYDDFSMMTGIYMFEEDENNKNEFLKSLADDYFNFLEATIKFYTELERFINCIDKRLLNVFIRMLD